MARKRWRFDPYKAFNFRVAAAAAVAGIAAFGITRTVLGAKRKKKRPPAPETGTGARPIEAVGTSTAGFVGAAPKKAQPGRRATRRRN
ncbi:MAG TPA: hypothetical protein VF027_07155 [Sphingomicrobium sp.]